MIKVGHTVAVPWGLDELECFVGEVYSSGGRQRIVVVLPEGLFGSPEPCPCCGHHEEASNTLSIPLDVVQLLPAKPVGLWLDNVKR